MDDFALSGCRLEPDGVRAQRDRYAALGRSVAGVARAPLTLTVEFGPGVDGALVERTLAVERDCCPFFALDYDPLSRRLTAAVPDAALDSALDALASALRATAA